MLRIAQLLFLVLLLNACTTSTDQSFDEFINNFDPRAGRTADDLSANTFGQEAIWLSDQIELLSRFDSSQLSFEETIDLRFARSILDGRHLRLTQHASWKKDPRTYMQFRSIGNLIDSPGDKEAKYTELLAKLDQLPIQLGNGERQLQVYIPRFQELSLFMAQNARLLFENDIPSFLDTYPNASGHVEKVSMAQTALESFIAFLENELPQKPQGDFSMGQSAYNQMLEKEFLLDYTDETLWEFGQAQFDKTVRELVALAKEIDPAKTWQQLAIEIKNDYPAANDMIEAHQLWVDSSKSHILRKGLIPIPWNEQVVVVPRAEYLRKTSYYGNFSRARGKDENEVFTANWMINPYEDQWDEHTKQEYLVEHDWGVIIVTAPHEAYGGHHVQSLYQLHNPRKIRRENGLSLFSEGWGLYNEQLMRETGFFPDKRIELRQLQLRLWRNARVIYDVGMHSGRLTYEEAIQLMTEKVGFLRWAAQSEIDASTARPGYFIGYFMGMTEILKMREKYKKKIGEEFTLSDFHERLLKIGNMPPSLLEESMMR